MAALRGDQGHLDSGGTRSNNAHASTDFWRKRGLKFVPGLWVNGAIRALPALLASHASVAPDAGEHLTIMAAKYLIRQIRVGKKGASQGYKICFIGDEKPVGLDHVVDRTGCDHRQAGRLANGIRIMGKCFI